MNEKCERWDAHIHLFEAGYENRSLSERIDVSADEIDHYRTLMQQHGVKGALVVGYDGESWCADNNRYLQRIAGQHDWLYPVAYVGAIEQFTLARLEQYHAASFVGLSFYLFDQTQLDKLQQVPDEIWQWLCERHWLISVNGKAKAWRTWIDILERHPALRLVISHLGLPPQADTQLNQSLARQRLAAVLALASYPQIHVKTSGFYALVEPGCSHQSAWPYVELIAEAYGVDRLLWGSDYSPHLDFVSHEKTITVITDVPFFNRDAIAKVMGGNLKQLLASVSRHKT